MQNLRDHLLKAGLITEEQRERAEARAEREARPRKPEGSGERVRRDRSRREPADGGASSPPERAGGPGRSKPGKKESRSQPVNRMVDLSDPKLLKIFQVIEQHRLRVDLKGDIAFHFTLRDGRVRKILINQAVSEGLESGRLAIVESGEPNRHVIVEAEAVALIRDVDQDAVRFCNV